MNLGETSGKSRTDIDLDYISRTLHRPLRKLGRPLHKLGCGRRWPTSKIDPSSPDLPVNYSQANKSYTGDGRVPGVSSEAPFLLPLCRVRRQTTRTRLYGLQKAPLVRNGAKGPFGPDSRSEQSVHSREMGWCVRCRSSTPFDRTNPSDAHDRNDPTRRRQLM